MDVIYSWGLPVPDRLVLTQLWKGTWLAKDSELCISELSVSVDNTKLAHKEMPPAGCQSEAVLSHTEETARLLLSLLSKSGAYGAQSRMRDHTAAEGLCD